MKALKSMVVSLLVVGMSVSFVSAKENLRVLYVFDSKTINYNQSKMYSTTRNLNNQLNKSFSNSDLSDFISFTKIGSVELDISNGGNLHKTGQRYWNYGKPAILGLYQKWFKADIVVIIMDTYYSDLCGYAINIPYNIKGFSDPDNSFIFLNYHSKKCYKDEKLIAHEVGHIFGIHHGQYGGDYVSGIANGYGVNVNWSLDYGTIMSKASISANKFSNPNSSTCGVIDKTNACGDSRSNAYQFIKNNAKYYNKRGGGKSLLSNYIGLDENPVFFVMQNF